MSTEKVAVVECDHDEETLCENCPPNPDEAFYKALWEKEKAEKVCEHDDTVEDDSETVMCSRCFEWTCRVVCADCDETVSSSACCG
jgi:hypothetical protein